MATNGISQTSRNFMTPSTKVSGRTAATRRRHAQASISFHSNTSILLIFSHRAPSRSGACLLVMSIAVVATPGRARRRRATLGSLLVAHGRAASHGFHRRLGHQRRGRHGFAGRRRRQASSASPPFNTPTRPLAPAICAPARKAARLCAFRRYCRRACLMMRDDGTPAHAGKLDGRRHYLAASGQRSPHDASLFSGPP